MPSEKPALEPNLFKKAANGQTAGSYDTGGRWNIGGWSTYPSADELAISPRRRDASLPPDDTRR